MLPFDETEKERLDIMHTMIQTIRPRENRLIHAPFRELPPGRTGSQRSRVLDLGCGTGIWALDVAEKYPQTEVLGIDLNRMGPNSLLDNVDIRVPVDYESPWSLGQDSWDLIHLQMGLGSVSSWPSLFRKIFAHLRPGDGWFESVEIDYQPRCNDNSLPQDAKLNQWYYYVSEAYHSIGRKIAYDHEMKRPLEEAGFTEVTHVEYVLPLNSWVPEDQNRATHRAGNWYQIAMSAFPPENHLFGLEAMSLAPVTKVNNWPVDHVRRLCAEAMEEAIDPRVHAYNVLHITTARKPHSREERGRR